MNSAVTLCPTLQGSGLIQTRIRSSVVLRTRLGDGDKDQGVRAKALVPKLHPGGQHGVLS